MTITPDQAKELLAGAMPGPWMLNPQGCILVDDGTDDPPGPYGFIGTMWKSWDQDGGGNGRLMAAAPALAETIAGMREEWRCEEQYGSRWYGVTEWSSTPDVAAEYAGMGAFPRRLVRRLVSAPEVVEGE